MKKLKKILAILILILIVLVIWIFNIYSENDTNNDINAIKENNVIAKYKKVTNPHMYLTVRSCAEKYLNYVYQQDTDSIYKILDSEYIKEFNISRENVFEFVENILNPSTLHIENMYVLEKSEDEHEYYISGMLKEDSADGISGKETSYIATIKLDLNNMIYSVIPNGYGGPLYEK